MRFARNLAATLDTLGARLAPSSPQTVAADLQWLTMSQPYRIDRWCWRIWPLAIQGNLDTSCRVSNQTPFRHRGGISVAHSWALESCGPLYRRERPDLLPEVTRIALATDGMIYGWRPFAKLAPQLLTHPGSMGALQQNGVGDTWMPPSVLR